MGYFLPSSDMIASVLVKGGFMVRRCEKGNRWTVWRGVDEGRNGRGMIASAV